MLYKIIAVPSPKAKEKDWLIIFHMCVCVSKPNFRLSGQKLYVDFKNPFKIVAEATPEQSEGETITTKNPDFQFWRYLLDKIRTFFEHNPCADQ